MTAKVLYLIFLRGSKPHQWMLSHIYITQNCQNQMKTINCIWAWWGELWICLHEKQQSRKKWYLNCSRSWEPTYSDNSRVFLYKHNMSHQNSNFHPDVFWKKFVLTILENDKDTCVEFLLTNVSGFQSPLNTESTSGFLVSPI